MITDRDILQAFAERQISLLRARIPKASGRTADGVRYEITDQGLRIYAPITLKTLVEGRGPSVKAPPMESILEWMEYRGIVGTPYTRKDGTMQDQLKADQSLAYQIANTIKRKGYKANESILKGWIQDSELRELAGRMGRNRTQEVLSDILKAVA